MLACESRRYWEADYEKRLRQAGRVPVRSERAAAHVAELGLTQRQLVKLLSCSMSTAVRLTKPDGFIPKGLERRVLELQVVE